MKQVIFVFIVLALSACAGRSVKVLDSKWASMKHSSPPAKTAALTSTGNFEETYCLSSWTGSFGLMDEVVKQAEQKYDIDYIKNASFSKATNSSCVSVVGEGVRILR